MLYPDFFDNIEPIELQDPLADILGVCEHGEYNISYMEVVKGAGHSCPTVAGAYLMTQAALHALYPDERAVRGNIDVSFAESLEEGVAGVIANVVTYITGATDKSGFKGLGGKFARHSLMHFHADIQSSARFTRKDTGKTIDVTYNPSSIPADPQMMEMMQRDVEKFGQMWQDRVKRIFENAQDVIVVTEL